MRGLSRETACLLGLSDEVQAQSARFRTRGYCERFFSYVKKELPQDQFYLKLLMSFDFIRQRTASVTFPLRAPKCLASKVAKVGGSGAAAGYIKELGRKQLTPRFSSLISIFCDESVIPLMVDFQDS